MNNRAGFTLAEILVTMGIIGVVSAITLPTLTQGWQKKSYTTQLHKVYNEVQQSFAHDLSEKNALNLFEANITRPDHMNTLKTCGSSGINSCFNSSYKPISSSSSTSIQSAGMNGAFVTVSGAAVGYKYYSSAITGDPDKVIAGTLYIDINGKQGPNIGGRDMFVLDWTPDGVVDGTGITINCRKKGTDCPSGNSAKEAREAKYASCKTSAFGVGCADKLINDNWVMNY